MIAPVLRVSATGQPSSSAISTRQSTDFAVRPERLFQKLGKIVGWDDIDIEESPRFSSMFWLQGSDPVEVRKLFRAEIARSF